MGSRECMVRQIDLVRATPARMDDFIRTVDIDPGFQSFVDLFRRLGHALVVVSDGLDRTIRTVLDRNDIDVPYFANHLQWRGDDRWRFLHLRTDRLVALAALLVLSVALDLAGDVGHGVPWVGLRPVDDSQAGRSATHGRIASRGSMDLSHRRAVSIIAHIDHGKTTLSDRILEICGAVDPRDMRAQYLDSMDLERERGITIKLQSVRLQYRGYDIDLIDTPGHVDFGYEVSRSLAACEGVVLLVDAAQGIEAQTLANCYLAMEHDLEIVACLNKIDLPAAEPERYAAEIEKVLGIAADDVLRISAKTGEGVTDLLDAVIERIPAPVGDPDAPLAGPHLRLALRPVPRRGVVGPGHGRHPHDRRPAPLHAGRRDARRRRGGGAPTRAHPGGGARAGGDRLPHRRHQGRR